MGKNPYEVLGVDKSADEKAIKFAYRKLAKKLHPDLNPNDKSVSEKFTEITHAYDLLSDKDKRAAFDRGEIDPDGNPTMRQSYYRDHAEGPQGYRYHSSSTEAPTGEENIEDIFANLFRNRGADSTWQTGQRAHTRYLLEISFLESANGTVKEMALPDGRRISLTIPAGAEDGQLLVAPLGPLTQGDRVVDAVFQLKVLPHKHFSRLGNDVHINVPIGFHESILGARIPIPTISGKVTMNIPKGASTGTKLRLKGKGINGGNQVVHLRIEMPPAVDNALTDAVATWAKSHPFNPRDEGEVK